MHLLIQYIAAWGRIISIVQFAIISECKVRDRRQAITKTKCLVWNQHVYCNMEYVIWMPTHKPTELSGNKQILNSAARPYNEWAFSPLVCTADWLWRYPCLQLLIFMLWPRQAIFESKEAKLSSSGECRIRSWEVWNTKSPADWMLTH